MAKRPIEAKQRRRAAKALRRTALPAYLDLIQWLKDRRYASTTGQARKIILDRRVKADSHVIGLMKVPVLQPDHTIKEQDVVAQHVPAELRGRITVT